jgi:hypothetical protein
MKMKPGIPALLGLAFLSGGCPLFSVEAEIEEACVVRKGIEVEAVPAGTTSLTESYDVSLDELGGLGDLLDLDADLEFVRFEARATSGIAELGFVDAAHVTVASGNPESALPTLVAYDCAGDCPVSGATLVVPATAQQDAADYLASGSLVVDVQVTGQLPATAWTMDVSVCVKGRATYALEL